MEVRCRIFSHYHTNVNIVGQLPRLHVALSTVHRTLGGSRAGPFAVHEEVPHSCGESSG
jgi:hypothetical protein